MSAPTATRPQGLAVRRERKIFMLIAQNNKRHHDEWYDPSMPKPESLASKGDPVTIEMFMKVRKELEDSGVHKLSMKGAEDAARTDREAEIFMEEAYAYDLDRMAFCHFYHSKYWTFPEPIWLARPQEVIFTDVKSFDLAVLIVSKPEIARSHQDWHDLRALGLVDKHKNPITFRWCKDWKLYNQPKIFAPVAPKEPSRAIAKLAELDRAALAKRKPRDRPAEARAEMEKQAKDDHKVQDVDKAFASLGFKERRIGF